MHETPFFKYNIASYYLFYSLCVVTSTWHNNKFGAAMVLIHQPGGCVYILYILFYVLKIYLTKNSLFVTWAGSWEEQQRVAPGQGVTPGTSAGAGTRAGTRRHSGTGVGGRAGTRTRAGTGVGGSRRDWSRGVAPGLGLAPGLE
jgi:hypothetical protein